MIDNGEKNHVTNRTASYLNGKGVGEPKAGDDDIGVSQVRSHLGRDVENGVGGADNTFDREAVHVVVPAVRPAA